MSSLAASRADGYYFPPEYLDNEVNKKMGLSKYQGSKGANQYQQRGVIRFELPFDAWCLKCERHLSKGLRFNAKKDKCGNYFSTTIFSFTTKCPSCDNPFVIKTDPKHNTYDYVEGLRKHEQDFQPEAGDGIIESTSSETKKKLAEDPIFKLQHEKEDKERALSARNRFAELVEISELTNKQDYDRNAALRRANRSVRKRAHELLEEGAKLGLSIPLVEPSEADALAAKHINFRSSWGENSGFEISRRIKEVDIKSGSIFKDKRNQNEANSLQKSMKKQAVHKISMKDVKLGKRTTLSTSVVSATPIVMRKKTKYANGEFKTPHDNDIDDNASGALSILGGAYASDDSDA